MPKFSLGISVKAIPLKDGLGWRDSSSGCEISESLVKTRKTECRLSLSGDVGESSKIELRFVVLPVIRTKFPLSFFPYVVLGAGFAVVAGSGSVMELMK